MKVNLSVEAYYPGGRTSVDVVLTEDDLIELAEAKVLRDYECTSAAGRVVNIELN